MGVDPDVVELADYLEEHGASECRMEIPPQEFWEAALQHLTRGEDLDALGNRAFDRGRLRLASELYRKAIRQGHAPAVEGLCHLYTETDRILTEQGRAELVEAARSVDDAGYSLWSVAAGLVGIGTEPDAPQGLLQLAAELLWEAWEAGHTDAVYTLEYVCMHLGIDATDLVRHVEGSRDDEDDPAPDLPREVRLLTKACDGDADAIAAVVRMVDEGGREFRTLVHYGGAHPDFLPVTWQMLLRSEEGQAAIEAVLRAVAQAGSPRAVIDLANRLFRTDRDQEALELLAGAAATGNDEALVKLCRRLWDNDPDRAEELVSHACREGRGRAAVSAVQPLLSPGRRPRLRRFALQVLRQLASTGDRRAQFELAEALVRYEADRSPDGKIKDMPSEVIELLEGAASTNPEACWRLGDIAELNGNTDKAAGYYLQALNAGHFKSLAYLAGVRYPSSRQRQEQVIRMGVEADGTQSPPW